MINNLLLNVDSYKTSHYLQYPPHTQYLSSYVESRGGPYNDILFFGLQMYLKEYLLKPFTREDIDEAEAVIVPHGLPFNREGWEYILNTYDGYMPVEISAVAEGTVLPVRNVLAQIINTDPKCAWVTNYLETSLVRAIWYPTTVATRSWHCKQVIKDYLEETAGDLSSLPFKLHDFGARGVSSLESAAIGGLSHLVSFHGTDTMSALVAAKRYYGKDRAAFSIPAAEHSTIIAWGKQHEAQAYEAILNQFKGPGKAVAIVSDSYDLWNAIDTIWGEQLRDQIKTCGGTVVIRPDSGEPVAVVTQAIKRLMDKFGYSVNAKGYYVLPPYLRVIQGDGISPKMIAMILEEMKQQKFSAENVSFGMGGELLQKVHRDTLKFAMKTSAININGAWHDVFKAPVTDPSKISKAGRLSLIKNPQGEFTTIPFEQLGNQKDYLLNVFKNGKLLVDYTFDDIRQRSENNKRDRTQT